LSVLSPGDFGSAETHRNPGSNQLQQELAGATAIVRQIIIKLNAGASFVCHDAHFKWRRACWKPVPVHRQPVPLGDVEEHCRVAAGGNDAPGRRIRFEPMLFEILLPCRALHPILSIEDKARSAIGIEHGRRVSQRLEPASGFLAARAKAGAGQNRRTDRLEFHLAALAGRGKLLVLLLVHSVSRFWSAIDAPF
jgi:hypothetical protein